MTGVINNDVMKRNCTLLASIGKDGIKSAVEVGHGNFNPSRDQRLASSISVNVLNKPVPVDDNWQTRAIRALLTDTARGIFPLAIERQSSDAQTREFYNKEEAELGAEVAKRVEHTVLFVLDPEKMHLSDSEKSFILGEQPSVRGEVLIQKTIPPEAILHVLIPEGLKDVASAVFNQAQFIGQTKMELTLVPPSGVGINSIFWKDGDYFSKISRTFSATVPDYQSAITQICLERFRVNNPKPLLFHVTRLFTPT